MKSIKAENVKVFDFIHRMDLAYSSANIIISRAGAGTISELCLVGKACILVPSPNVAEDHQTKNAKALVEQDAALMITDKDSASTLVNTTLDLLNNKELIDRMEVNIHKMALPNSAQIIAQKVIELAQEKK
jgi:UDP-N-acetylglucosamine--N-acetylmuramyl-(pentapeptide) pyrophosphoryl-undecaprenol N-acetylglucosamine transferase